MIVQIYSLTDADDVRALVEIGVDHIGLVPGTQGLPNEVDDDDARTLFALLPSTLRGSALTISTDLDAIVAMALRVNPSIVHICSETDALSEDQQQKLRQLLPSSTRIMKSIEVGGPETAEQAFAAAARFAPVSDFLLVDSGTPEVPGIGAAGRVHDWDISARIVEMVGSTVPVILAGGLSPENVADAIRHVRPAGVDSFTSTNSAHDARRKDPARVRDFVHEARRAAAAVGL
jgi:phosphoribosylanthranilate isomerase